MKNKYFRDIKLEEPIIINGSKVIYENGVVKTILSEEIKKTGYMSVEDAKQLTIAAVTKIYQMNGDIDNSAKWLEEVKTIFH